MTVKRKDITNQKILTALNEHLGNMTAAAKELGTSR